MLSMMAFRKIGVALVLSGVLALTGCTSTGSSSSNTSTARQPNKAQKQRPSDIDIDVRGKVTRSGEVYLLRGLANVFSRGMDAMGARLVRAGVDARVYNHAAWKDLAANIVARHKRKQVSYPVIIMGHSLGGNASTKMAKYLGDRGVKVSYVVAFDPTVTTYVGRNVRKVINYYLPNDEHSNIVRKAPGFNGSLTNKRVTSMAGVTHMNVEKNRTLQNRSIRAVMSLTKKKRSRKRRRG